MPTANADSLAQMQALQESVSAFLEARGQPGTTPRPGAPGPNRIQFGDQDSRAAEVRRSFFVDTTVSPKSIKRGFEAQKNIRKLEVQIRAFGDEPPNIDTGSPNKFFELLANIQRPQSAIFNTAIAIFEGDTDPEQIAEAFWKGLTFEQRATGIDLLDATGHDTDQFVNKVAAFGIDIVLDPANIPAVALLPFRILTMGAKGANRIRVVRELGEAAGKSRVIQSIKRGFTNRTGNLLFDRIARSNINLKNMLESDLLARAHQHEVKHGFPLARKSRHLEEQVPVLAEFFKAQPEEYARRLAALKVDDATRNQVDAAVKSFDSLLVSLRNGEEVAGVATPTLGNVIAKGIDTLDKAKKARALKEITKVARTTQRDINRLKKKQLRLVAKVPESIEKRFVKFKDQRLPGVNMLTDEGIRVVGKGVEKEIRQLESQLNGLRKLGKFLGPNRKFRGILNDFISGTIDDKGLRSQLDRFLRDPLSTPVGPSAKTIQKFEEFATLQRFDPAGVIPDVTKPQGLFLTPGGVKSPHADLGVRSDFIASAKNPLDVSKTEGVIRRGADSMGAGAKALKQLDPELFNRLKGMRFEEVEREVKRLFPKLRIRGTRDKQDLMEVVGAQLAKRKGFDAIISRDVSIPSFSEFVALTSGAIRKKPSTLKPLTGFTASLSLRHLPGVINQVSRRRAALSRLADIQTNAPKLVKETTEMLLDGVFSADELIEIVGKEAPGIQGHIKNVARRVAEVEKHVGDIDDIPRFAQEVVEEFMRGSVTGKEVIELLGKPAKGAKVGQQTLGQALNALKKTVTAIDNIQNKVVPQRIKKIEVMLDSRYGQKIHALEEAMSQVPNYIPHVMTREGMDALVKPGRGGLVGRLFSDKHASLIMRKFVNNKGVPLTFEEVEAIVSKGELASIGGKPLFKSRSVLDIVLNRPLEAARLFSVTPQVILATRSLRSAKAISGAKFLDEVGKAFGRVVKKGDTLRPGEAFSSTPRLRGVAFDSDIVKEVDRVFTSAYGNDEATNAVVKVFDTMQNYWKTWTLGIFPAYHVRNAIGNVWNMHLAGMFPILNPADGIEDMIKAGQLQRWGSTANMEKLANISITLHDGTKLNGHEILRLMQRHGILNEGMFGADIERGTRGVPFDDLRKFYQRAREDPADFLRRQVGLGKKGGRRFQESIIGGEGVLTEQGLLFGKAVENNAKGALFLFKLRKGHSIEEAAEIAQKFLFDYQDLTAVDRAIKKGVPFWTWTRKNIPLQLEQLVKQPEKFSRIEKAGRFASSVGGLSKEELPEAEDIPKWIKEAAPVPLRRLPDGRMEFFLLENWLPAADIDNLLAADSAARFALNSLRPELQLGIEFATGRDIFTERALRGPEALPQEFLGAKLSPQIVNVLRTIRLLTVLDNLNPFGLTRQERLSDDPNARAVRFLTGIKPFAVSTKRERISRDVDRETQLRRQLGRAKKSRRRQTATE